MIGPMVESVPSVPAFYWPTLIALRGFEGPVDRATAIEAALKQMSLSEGQLAAPGHGRQSMAAYRASWALSHLKIMGLAENVGRGQWEILPDGRSIVEDEVLSKWREVSKRYRQQTNPDEEPEQTWVVGAVIDGVDQTARFVEEGVWQIASPNGIEMGYLQSMRAGDRIAIKSSFVQRRDLPFDNAGKPVSANRFKARGVITRVGEDEIYVDWEEIAPPRDWYFYTNQRAMWRLPQVPEAEQLEAFIFEEQPQDYDLFLNMPYWRDRYVSSDSHEPAVDFEWVPFNEAVVDALLERRDDRPWLAGLVQKIRANHGQGTWHDKFPDGVTDVLADIDPGTFMAIYNLGPTPHAKRQRIAQDIAEALGVDLLAPGSFEGVPITHPQNAWLFTWAKDRGDSIDLLWDVFAAATNWADDPESGEARAAFVKALGPALDASNWTLATALYRARPNWFCPMDGNTKAMLSGELGIQPPKDAHAADAASDYVAMLDRVHAYLGDPASPVHTMPELSQRAWEARSDTPPDDEDLDHDPKTAVLVQENQPSPYTLDDLIDDGCFVPRPELERLLAQLERTKNLILQGAPGTGKTWLAKRLGWVLAGTRSTSKIQVVQFHPNTSYEDFVRGFRPTSNDAGAAGLKLVDGPLIRLADKAKADQAAKYTMVIEEINRGNPARAFGEVLTLIEASKRSPQDAIHLTYETPELEPDGFWIPKNLHVVGTMNIADRSLALIDLALRRRFAFVTLQPHYNQAWKAWLMSHSTDTDAAQIADSIAVGVSALNERITAEPTLGANFVVGHSFFTPDDQVDDLRQWFNSQVESSVRPLLHEYWFDDRKTADQLADTLAASCQ